MVRGVVVRGVEERRRAHEQLVRLVIEVQKESEDTSCVESAQATFNAETSDMVAEQERATDKIEESQTFLVAIQPIFEEMRTQIQQVEMGHNR